MEYTTQQVKKDWKKKSSAAGPTVLGIAAGIFLGDMMHRGARRPVAFSLACLGMAAIAPSVVGAVKKKVAGPQTRRGANRTLESIRNAGMPDGDASAHYLGDDLGDQMHIV